MPGLEYRDNMPENLQSSERDEQADETCDNPDEAVCGLDDVIRSMESAIEQRRHKMKIVRRVRDEIPKGIHPFN